MSKHRLLKIFGWAAALALWSTQSFAQTTIGSKGCKLGSGGCHLQEEPWWKKDKHFLSVKTVKAAPDYQAIAQKYEISLTNAADMNEKCMKCHGTVISASAKTTIATDGVSCESCHGPGSDYKDPHAEVEGKGYENGIKFGMRKNQDLNIRATRCVECHYISEKKLLDAGHSAGRIGYSFYIQGMKDIKPHWRKFKIEADGVLQKAFDTALKNRGAKPVAVDPQLVGRGGTRPSIKTHTSKRKSDASRGPIVETPKPQRIYEDVIEPPAKYQTLGPKGSNGCGLGQTNCHTTDNEWWIKDKDHKHYNSYRKFLDPSGAYATYLKKYDNIIGNQTKINQICMKCHGTVISAKADKEVTVGVSCESCHGPGSGYRDPHVEGDTTDGLKRTGYLKGLELGMLENKNFDVRATTCARCHYITEQKLIARTGHSTGQEFDYFDGIQKVAPHWDHPVENEDILKAAYANAMVAKGSPPPMADTDETEPALGEESSDPGSLVIQPQPDVPPDAQPIRIGRSSRSQLKNAEPINLPEFPRVGTKTPLDSLILILKRRLDTLSKAGGGSQP